MSKKPTNAAEAASTAAVAVDTVNPGEKVTIQAAEQGGEIVIDQQMLQQAVQMRNARLIASMVHENAMLEVALEQERRARLDAESKVAALEGLLSES